MKDEARYTKVPLPIVCSLSTPNLAERGRELTRNVFGGALGVEGLEDGYEFVFPGGTSWATRLVEVINAERACCPFFAFELRFEPGGGPIRLRVRGPEGAKEFMKTELIEIEIEQHGMNAEPGSCSMTTPRSHQPLLDA